MVDEMNLENARGWRPEVGNVITGKVVDIARGWSDQKEAFYPIVTIEPENPVRVAKVDKFGKPLEDQYEKTTAPVAVHCFHTVLYMRVVELKPEIGERIGIKFAKDTVKDKNSKKGNTPAVYNVKIEGRASDVWDVMTVDPREAAAKARNVAAVPDVPVIENTDDTDDIPF